MKSNYFSNTIFNKKLLLSLLVFISFSLPAFAQNEIYFPPENEWEIREPASLNVATEAINKTISFAESNEYSGPRDLRLAILRGFEREPFHKILGPTKDRGGPAGLIIKDGYIIAEWGDTRRVDMTFSVTKSYLSTTAGLALDAGLIESVEDKVHHYVWDNTFKSDHNKKVTWNHLLTQSSDWSGDLFGLHDWADRPPRKGGIDDWRNRELNEPGTVFEYNDVRVNVLAYSLLQVWRKPLPQVLKERVMDPIGASTTWRWYGYENSWINVDGIKMQSVSGGGHSGGGMFINTRDHARFGLLFQRNGKWNGKQLISPEWIEKLRASSPAFENYGYMWWLNNESAPRHMEGVPDHIYYAAGFGGNFIVVDDKNDLVVVTRWLEPSKLGDLLTLVYEGL